MTAPGDPNARFSKMRSAVSDIVQQVKDEKAADRAAKQREIVRRRRKERLRWLWLGAAIVALVISIVVMLPRWRQPIAPPTGDEALRHGRETVALAAELVEQYRTSHGALPGAIVDVTVPLPGVVYRVVRDGQGYVLTLNVEGQVLEYRSGEDLGAFRAGR
jgi:hypothetical protein